MNLLVSEAYLTKGGALARLVKQAAMRGHAIMIDSGAFTNFGLERQGKPPKITLPSYIAHCQEEYAKWAWGYVMLDKVRDAKTTQRNLDAMLAAGLKPMAVYTLGEDLSRLNEFVAINPKVCVAGAPYARDQWINNRYIEAFEASEGKARIHGLGYGRIPDLFRLPITSCDSSALSNGGQWGNYFIYDKTSGMSSYRKETLASAKPMRYLARCGVPTSIINQPKHWSSGDKALGTMMTYAAYCFFMDHATQLGYRYFCAISSRQTMAAILAVYQAMRPDGTFDYMEAQRLRVRIMQGDRVPYRPPFFGSRCWDDEQ